MTTTMKTEGVTVLHGDCLELMKQIPDGTVDAIVTDPPYGTEAERDGYGRRQNYGTVGRKIAGDSDLSVLAGMLREAPRILKPHTWVAIFCSPKRHAEAAELLELSGFPVGGEVIWDKASPGLGGGIRYQHETIILAKHGNATGKASLFSVIRSHVSRVNKHLRHPHEKPVDLMCDLVRYCCPKGGIVLDPFAGGGPTGVACLKTGRKAILMESDSTYLPMIERHIKSAETPLFSGLLTID